MTFTIGVHFDNADQLTDPHLAFWFPGGGDPTVVAAMGSDGFGARPGSAHDLHGTRVQH
jgi:hypothetical protein